MKDRSQPSTNGCMVLVLAHPFWLLLSHLFLSSSILIVCVFFLNHFVHTCFTIGVYFSELYHVFSPFFNFQSFQTVLKFFIFLHRSSFGFYNFRPVHIFHSCLILFDLFLCCTCSNGCTFWLSWILILQSVLNVLKFLNSFCIFWFFPRVSKVFDLFQLLSYVFVASSHGCLQFRPFHTFVTFISWYFSTMFENCGKME